MSDRNVFLAVDLGASSGRVMAARYDGKRLELSEAHRFPNAPEEMDGTYRWPIHELFARVKEGLAKAGRTYGDAIASIGVDTWGVDYGLLDDHGELVDLPFAYRDERTQGMEEEAARRVPTSELYRVTGTQPAFYNTLYQLLSEVVARRPELDRAKRLLFTPDLINYWLCGRAVNEYSIASTSQLLDAQSRAWATSLMEQLGLPSSIFGEIVPPGTRLGELSGDVAQELGLPHVDVVAVGSHDTASAVAAVPVSGDAPYAYLSSGTWSLMGIESPQPILTETCRAYGFTNEGGVGGTIRVLKNIAGLWLVQECRRVWAEAGDEADFGQLVDLAVEAEPFVALIDPDDPSFATPGDMPQRIRTFCENSGQRVPATHGEIIRVILESLALRYRQTMERLDELAGTRMEVLHIVGGGVQNELLNQFTASAVNRRVVTGPVEATAAGNVIMQLVAAGHLADPEAGRALVANSFDTRSYEPVEAGSWDASYRRFMEVLTT